ncbi:hypothetical protein [Dialister succinatiphilus]|uniref:hypothetical protein n=1 Tax=Dialister succinatiphilus TaxID=487173 RepID=UPI003AAC5F66
MKSSEEVVMAYVRQLEDMEEEVSRLLSENRILKGRLEGARRAGTPTDSELLASGKEKDLYPGERHEILLDILKSVRKDMKNGTRRADILDDLIKANPVSGEPKRRSEAVKVALKGYRGLDDNIKRKLAALGIEANEKHRKHYLLKYYGDPRYFVTMTATGSDAGRGGMNLASDMIRNFF